MKHLLTALSTLSLSLNLLAGELPAETTAKLIKVVVNGSGGKIMCRDGAMKAALESAGVQTEAGSKIVWSSNPTEIRMMKSQGKLIITSRPENLGLGASIAITEDGGKPKIYLHSGNLAASGVTVSDAILKIGEKA
jgi:hypothetical protein